MCSNHSVLCCESTTSSCILPLELKLYLALGCDAINLGTGHGASVLEMVAAFEKASGKVNFCFSLHLLSCKY